MENQDPKLNNPQTPPKPNPRPAQNQSPYSSIPSAPKVTDEQAKNLLVMSGLATDKSLKHSKWPLIIIVILLLISLIAGLYVNSHQSNKKSGGPSISLPGSKNSPLEGSSVNQQTKYCSNIINANTVC
ncbi:MAG TPA: hypothetical protein VL989_01185 [Candidatus Sulfotelmatobacter sp.]|nr:hypothetical protein [Candidatus Sulfotelmatobacter sp.]